MVRNGASSSFDLDRVASETFVRQIEFHRTLPSTNDLALELAGRAEFDTPLLVLAERQTAGRGRGTNRWWAAEGALTFSIVFDVPHLGVTPARFPQLSLVTGVAVSQALEQSAPAAPFTVKWPNDVLLNTAKVCGILMEFVPPRSERFVAGIGINVNNSFRDAPPDVRQIGTSLFDVTDTTFDVTQILVAVLKQLEHEYACLARRDTSQPLRWQKRSFLTGRDVTLRVADTIVRGTCRGLADDGALLVETTNGVQAFHGGVIEACG